MGDIGADPKRVEILPERPVLPAAPAPSTPAPSTPAVPAPAPAAPVPEPAR